MIHVASTNVPFTSESKDAVANVPEIEREIELAVREAARELKSFLSKRRSMQQRREKQDKLTTILPEMADKLGEVTGRPALNIDDTMARIMNNVLVERDRENGQVRLTVENNTDASTQLAVTDIVTAEPDLNGGEADGDPTVVEMDGEYFLKWEPDVPGGGEATLAYDLDGEADCELSVEGIEDEKLTVDA
jgi:DNA topoisomerase VI, subunit B